MDGLTDIAMNTVLLPNGVELDIVPLGESDGKRVERVRMAEAWLTKRFYGEVAQLEHRESGEPYVSKDGKSFEVSISHSRKTLCMACCTKRLGGQMPLVGVDVEAVQERLYRLKDKYLSASEQEGMELSLQNLTICWCAKEAIYKIVGKRAGFMGEHIVLHTNEIDGEKPFTAYCDGQRFSLTPRFDLKDEVIVTATCLNVYKDMFRMEHEQGRHHLAVLLDPDKTPKDDLERVGEYIQRGGVSLVLVGGSGYEADIEPFVQCLENYLVETPVVLFPGSPKQLTRCAEAMLLLSLLSGRDAQYLVGQHVDAAQRLRREVLETISTGYILVDGGRQSSVERVSGTQPLCDRQEIVDTAYAGALLGMQAIYLEAGSGAKTPVDVETIKAVRSAIDLPLLVGGGIRTIEQMHRAFAAGADIVVIGNYFEQHPEDIVAFGKAVDKQ